eukprot:comp22968_c0_seq2/m.36484 comp22968_c0_seq2/g.36484  ORF comp22968_c0_seq2/g.36484 comp22968_c0_seq2/m.36484 type:complete len:202 (-) comp22968_c0_seq2:421-1026(-)
MALAEFVQELKSWAADPANDYGPGAGSLCLQLEQLKAEAQDTPLVLAARHQQAAAYRAAVLALEYKDAGKTREQYDIDVAARIEQERPDVIVLAGWMHIVSKAFLDVFGDIVINLHPALPDQFDGTHAIDRAYAAYQAGTIAHTGVMVHMVTPQVDKGRVLATEVVPIHPTDSLEDLETRMHQVEHRILVQAVADFVKALP